MRRAEPFDIHNSIDEGMIAACVAAWKLTFGKKGQKVSGQDATMSMMTS